MSSVSGMTQDNLARQSLLAQRRGAYIMTDRHFAHFELAIVPSIYVSMAI